MKKPVIISADSTCDLSPELVERFKIKIIPLTILLGSESFYDDGSFSPDMMYERYHQDGTLPKTSAVSVQQFLDFFSPYVEAGYEVVHLDISSELSCTFANAHLAASELEGIYPVDSMHLSTGVALLAIEAAKCRDEGMDAAGIAAHLNTLSAKVESSFVLDTLEFMWKGGRCSAVTSLGANLLKLKPALEMKGGKLGVYKKYRGATSSVYKQYIKERLTGKNIISQHIFLTQSGEIDEATLAELEAYIHEFAPDKEILRATAGCTVSSHCGPKTMGVLFISE